MSLRLLHTSRVTLLYQLYAGSIQYLSWKLNDLLSNLLTALMLCWTLYWIGGRVMVH